MNFEEYRLAGRDRYAAFVEAIRHILKVAVKAQEMKPYAITGRAKELESLARKLDDRGIDPASAIDEEIKDLAGARIVFLTEGQIYAFQQAGILHDNFDILNVNVHHPVPETESETRLFDSTNYLVKLKSDRLALPEYDAFEGLRAEIQVQTLLNHAWAEMGHDTIYKQPILNHVGEKQLAKIKDRMDRVMREYLLPAGHDFDKIARDFHQLLEADQNVDGAIETLTDSADNDALHDVVGMLDDLILPQLDDRGAEFLRLLPLLIDAVERTRGSPAGAVETPFGSLPGKSGEDIALKISHLIRTYRYSDPAQTFTTLVRFYSGATTDSERKIWVDLATQFSASQKILDGVGKLGGSEIAASRGLIMTMLRKSLSAEVAGMSATSTSVTIGTGIVPANEQVAKLRADAIAILEKLLDEAADDVARQEVLTALRGAGVLPIRGGSDALVTMIIEDAARVIAIEKTRIGQWGLELRRNCEVEAFRWHHRLASRPPEMADQDAKDAAAAAQQKLVAELQALRDALNADPEFVRYKALVGHDSVRPDAWDGKAFDSEATHQWRQTVFKSVVKEITDDTVDEWIKRIRTYIAESKSNGDHLRPLGDCFELFGQTKPNTAHAFLGAMDDALSPLLISLLSGLERAGHSETIRRYADRWIDEGRFLGLLGGYLRGQEPFDIDMLGSLAARSIEQADEKGVFACLNTAAFQYDKAADQRLIDKVFMPAIGYLTGIQKYNWIHFTSGVRKGSLVAALTKSQAQGLLDSFVGVSEISYEEDMLLAVVAWRFPGLVLGFFEARIQREHDGSGLHFDPIPFLVYTLREPLSTHPQLVIDAAQRWFERECRYHEHRGGRLLCNIFPTLAEIAAPLGELVKQGNRDDISFVIASLLAYEGAEQIYPLCMEIVDALEEGDVLLKDVTHVLDQKGVMRGDFGSVAAEKEHWARLDPWRDDPRPKVQAYAREQQRRVDQSMASEQRRAEHDVEQRRRDWGEA